MIRLITKGAAGVAMKIEAANLDSGICKQLSSPSLQYHFNLEASICCIVRDALPSLRLRACIPVAVSAFLYHSSCLETLRLAHFEDVIQSAYVASRGDPEQARRLRLRGRRSSTKITSLQISSRCCVSTSLYFAVETGHLYQPP